MDQRRQMDQLHHGCDPDQFRLHGTGNAATANENQCRADALAAAGAPFVARGAGTGLSAGSLADGIVMMSGAQLVQLLQAAGYIARPEADHG